MANFNILKMIVVHALSMYLRMVYSDKTNSYVEFHIADWLILFPIQYVDKYKVSSLKVLFDTIWYFRRSMKALLYQRRNFPDTISQYCNDEYITGPSDPKKSFHFNNCTQD